MVAALLTSACAKTVQISTNDAAKRNFDAWMYVNYPDLTPTPLGAYVIEETEGEGALLGSQSESGYVRMNYTVTDLEGNVTSTSSEEVSKQIGDYDETYYYGPRIWCRLNDGVYAGVDEALSTMRVGGYKKTIIPGWLFSTTRYGSAEEYVQNVNGANAIYSMEVVEVIDDIEKWEIDSLSSYMARVHPEIPVADSLKYGFYYIQRKAPADTNSFPTDSTIYINYVGRLLDGRVFDTNIRDTAKLYGLYSSSRTYEPALINWDKDDYSNLTMTTDKDDLIDGFKYLLWHMRSYEKATGIFYSGLGYGASGSGEAIPEYSPLIFDVDIVDEE